MVFSSMSAFILTLKLLMWKKMKKVLSRLTAHLRHLRKEFMLLETAVTHHIWQLVAAVRDGALAATAANEYIESLKKQVK